jgi:hypothetical protein
MTRLNKMLFDTNNNEMHLDFLFTDTSGIKKKC